MPFKIGDSVKVKEGIMCPDDVSVCIGGWQGRVFEIENEDNIIGIRWDSITLKQLPLEYIKRSEEEGLDWTEIYLSAAEIESTSPRDTEARAEEMAQKMESKFQRLEKYEEDKRILKVLDNADDEIKSWNSYLRGILKFPFEAKVSEYQEQGPLKDGDKVQVQKITEADDLYGILVDVQYGRRGFVFPLCDLTVLDKQSANYTPVQDYCVWFANR